MLNIKNLNTYYDRVQALHDINIHIDEGELVALIGPNGAGKTTLFRSISKLLPCEGEIRLDGQDISNFQAHQVNAAGIAHSPEGRLLFPDMSVLDNLKLGAFRNNDRKSMQEDLDHVFSVFPVLHERQAQLARTMSGGEQQMLAIGRALMTRPKILILDEPSFGIAPIIVDRIFEAIKALNAEGLTTFFSEQNVHVAFDNAERTYVLEQGRILMEGDSETLRHDPKIAETYLGM